MDNMIGTATTNILTGTSGNNLLNGKAGDDYIDGGGGSDIIIAGAGNDTIVYDEIDKKVDGGTGYDTLLFLGTNQSLNLSTNLAVSNIEQFWLYGGGGHQVWLTAADIIRVSDTDRIVIKTETTSGGSVIHPGDGWHFDSLNADGQSLFVNGGASLLVDQGIFVDGFSKNAVITVPDISPLVEDMNLNGAGMLQRDANITVTDVNAGQGNLFLTPTYVMSELHYAGGIVSGSNLGNIGNLSLTSNGAGSYLATYTVDNSLVDIQALRQGDFLVEKFKVFSWDGTSSIISFTVKGADEIVNHVPTTTASSPVHISISGVPVFDEDVSYIRASGQFDVSDTDLQDVLGASWSGNQLGTFNAWVEHTDPSSAVRTVKWTYSVDGEYMASLDPAIQKTDNFTLSVSDGHGGTISQDINALIDPTLQGTPYASKYIGTDVNDVYEPDSVQQWIYGGAGNDRILPLFGKVLLMGGGGDDYLDTYSESPSTGIIAGGTGNDFIRCIANGERAYGGAGNDTIDIKSGNEIASGGSGDDIFLSWGGDSIDGNSGNDQINLGDDAHFSGIPISLGFNAVVHGNDGDDMFSVARNSCIAWIYGDSGNDRFELHDSITGNRISGGDGIDKFLFYSTNQNSDLWVTDFDFGNGSSTGDVLDFSTATENYINSSFQLNLVTSLSGNEPPGITSYYKLVATDTNTSASHTVLNIIASDLSSAHTTADILGHIISH